MENFELLDKLITAYKEDNKEKFVELCYTTPYTN